jgi:hypothetical protein
MNKVSRKDFSDAEVSTAIEQMRTKCPEILDMMERRELGETVASRDEWIAKVFELAPILNEIGLTKNLSEISDLRFQIRKEIRKRLGLPV